jgi:aerobic carbon-monoxide dehydrogenase medium subunit
VITLPFEYRRATSLDDALAQLTASNGEAKLIAGGHSLVPAMKLRLSEPKLLIDIAGIPGLSGVHRRGHTIEIGAATVHQDVAASPLLADECPMLAEAAGDIGDRQVRNRGTIGGSLAHADPAADYPAVVLALGAEIHVKSARGWRVVKADDFFVDLFTVDLAADEIIASIHCKPMRAAAYAKLHQRASRFAIVGVAAALHVTDGMIESARIAVTGASSHATRLPDVEHALAGKPATAHTVEHAAAAAGASLEHLASDIHASSDYRRAMIPVFTRRALKGALARA